MHAKRVNEAMKYGDIVFMMLALLNAKGKKVIGDLPIICYFPYVSPEDISDLPS